MTTPKSGYEPAEFWSVADNIDLLPLIGYNDQRTMQLHCRPAPLCNLPDPRFTNLVADRVTLRSQSVSGFSSSALVTGADLVRTVRGTQCTAEINPLRLPNFPNGFEGLLP